MVVISLFLLAAGALLLGLTWEKLSWVLRAASGACLSFWGLLVGQGPGVQLWARGLKYGDGLPSFDTCVYSLETQALLWRAQPLFILVSFLLLLLLFACDTKQERLLKRALVFFVLFHFSLFFVLLPSLGCTNPLVVVD